MPSGNIHHDKCLCIRHNKCLCCIRGHNFCRVGKKQEPSQRILSDDWTDPEFPQRENLKLDFKSHHKTQNNKCGDQKRRRRQKVIQKLNFSLEISAPRFWFPKHRSLFTAMQICQHHDFYLMLSVHACHLYAIDYL